MTLAWLLASLLSSTSAPATLRVSVEPNYVILQGEEGRDVIVTTDVRDAAGKPVREAALLSDATAGNVDVFHEVEPGRYQAVMRRPAENFPQAGVITVFVEPSAPNTPPLVGTAVVQYAAEIDLHGRTEPGARMRVDIAGRTFGPVVADGKGLFALPVTVPPGAGTARGISTDTLGNASTSSINLYLPALDRLHAFVYPRVPVADGHSPAWIFVTCLSTSGAPQKGTLASRGARGTLGAAQSLATGVWRVPYVPPTRVAPGYDSVHFSAPLEADEQIALTSGPATRLTLVVNPNTIPADGTSTTLATLSAFDAHDNPADVHAPHIAVDGTPVDANRLSVGVHTATLAARTRIGPAQVTASAAAREDTPPLAATPVPITWRIPTPVSLALSVLQRRADGWVLRIDTHGDAQVAARLALQASRGTVKRLPDGTWLLSRATPPGDSVDVIARDAQTGVSAWLRVAVDHP